MHSTNQSTEVYLKDIYLVTISVSLKSYPKQAVHFCEERPIAVWLHFHNKPENCETIQSIKEHEDS